jgi:tetratricopeptide (TPR) repeat protein
MSKYTRKQRNQSQDQFVGFWQKFFEKVAPYARAIGITLATTLAIVLVVWAVSSWRESRAESAAESFGRAIKIYDADLVTDANPAEKSDEENPVPRFKTEKERADATLAALDDLDKKWGSTDVAKNAALFRAGVYYDQGRYDDAARYYKDAATRAGDDPSMRALAREGQGLCDEARNRLDEALAAYQALEPKSGDFFRDRALCDQARIALCDQARIYLKKGDKKKAGNLYKEALAKMPQSPLRDEIQNQLAVLEGT